MSQDKAKTELAETEADLDKWQEVLTVAIRLAGSCHAAYLKANPKVRRRFNDAVLKAVYVEDGKIKRAEFTDVFAALFSRPSSNKWVKVPPAVSKVPPAGTEQHGHRPHLRFSRQLVIEGSFNVPISPWTREARSGQQVDGADQETSGKPRLL